MSVISSEPFILRNGNDGLFIIEGLPKRENERTLCETAVRCVDVCENGQLIAFSDTKCVKVVKFPNYDTVLELNVIGIQFVKFSPKGTVLSIWSPYKTAAPGFEGEPNLHLYRVENGTLLQSFVQKKMSRWCPQWSYDETLTIRHLNSELHFYENNDFKRYVKKMSIQKVADFSLSTNRRTQIHYVACYSLGVKGQPSFVRLYQYPNFEGHVIANKSFYKADSVNFIWNSRGDALLLLCVVDVDKSGKSYYGEQMLHYLDTSGQTYVVKLNKDGPIHNVAWTPSQKKEQYFGVVYGFLPAKAALFNCKSELVMEFGEEQPINLISFNPFGNLVVLAGFGNLRGGVFVWDIDKKRLIAKFKCPETTDISWSPNGSQIMVATTSPRLRVGNGFKILNYDGTILYAWPKVYSMNLEVYKVLWQPIDSKMFNEPTIPNNLAVNEEKKSKENNEPAKYVPPALRKAGGDSKQKTNSSTKTTLSENEKRIKTLEKKLGEIKKLKELRDSGKQLEKNQLEKINKEEDLEEELLKLKLS